MRAIHATGEVCPCGPRPPESWQEGLKRLAAMPRTPFMQQVLVDARAFWRDGWAELAASQGWGTLDLFGAHSRAPERRHDCKGLVCCLRGARLYRLEEPAAWIAQEAVAEDIEPDGFGGIPGCTRYIRRAFRQLDRRDLPPCRDGGRQWPGGTVPVWELVA